MRRQHQRESQRAAIPGALWSRGEAKALRVTAVLAGLIAVGAVGIALRQAFFPGQPERLVTLYRVHGCRCAFTLAQKLEQAGFTVKMFEVDTLKYVRASLHAPTGLRGCHLGRFLGYFVEGHVTPDSLNRLAQLRPIGYGVAALSDIDLQPGHTRRSDMPERIVFFAGRGESERVTLSEFAGASPAADLVRPDGYRQEGHRP